MPMHPVARTLDARGGVATRAELRRWYSAREIRLAVEDGHIMRDGRGHYALATADDGLRAARRLRAVMMGRSAAAFHGWRLKTQPSRPEIAVPRGRKVAPAERERCLISWRALTPSDLAAPHVTNPVRTVIDCATRLPFDEALAIADSALRNGNVTRDQLLAAATQVKRAGRQPALRVARHADPRAENPFESVVRAVSLDVPGLALRPQVPISSADRTIHPDLVDGALGIVVEADSYEYHTSRQQIDIDCHRYTELGLDGWLVLRVSHQQAMRRQTWLRSAFERAVQYRRTTPFQAAQPL
ncbi:hypothetical protein N864_09240 [Intrasporangium chromatireducens Q5-1]|uniref:DUF559 domain-containing protein n=1 Tax=Intrasporangium chromatireducens Q5-1 TaxID=584657 RepID=W9GMA5_9MICO|nr:hypothetical protein [Intrasporangium chromatireducens]EWT07235.1 hypothetical protein N864_09240 [Intrasporangium chromatireducens Q5-1]